MSTEPEKSKSLQVTARPVYVWSLREDTQPERAIRMRTFETERKKGNSSSFQKNIRTRENHQRTVKNVGRPRAPKRARGAGRDAP